MSTAAPTHTRRNGAKHTVEVVEAKPSQRLDTVRTAVTLYQSRDDLPREDVYALARVLGESGLLAYGQIAAIAGVSVTTLKRRGVHVPGQRKGGACDPAQLENVLCVLRTLDENGTYEVQRIRQAHEGGISAGVLGRLLGLSHTYVLKLVRMARDDRDLEYTDTYARRVGRRRGGVEAGVSDYTLDDHNGGERELSAYERDVMARFATGELDLSDVLFTDENDSVDESGTTEDEAGQPDGADDSAAGSAPDLFADFGGDADR